jgi:hypothetical protein
MPADTALHRLLEVPPAKRTRSKASIDAELLSERDW